MTELERCLDFIRGMAHRGAGEKVPTAHGLALLEPTLPDVWSRNYLLLDDGHGYVTAHELAEEVDAVFKPAGLRHRKVEVYDDVTGARLEPGFLKLGWSSECDVIMVAKRPPDREADTSAVDEVGVDDLVPAWSEGWRLDPHVFAEDVARQLIDNKRRLPETIDTRFFAARADGEVAAYCELYSDGRTAQIENVLTLERFRNRGLARAAVSKALSEARAAGHDLVFLIADRDDWPKELYAKLGFDVVGRIWEFLLPRAM
jgi:ribosomal protein S18 acetylase RimI-like enzyme